MVFWHFPFVQFIYKKEFKVTSKCSKSPRRSNSPRLWYLNCPLNILSRPTHVHAKFHWVWAVNTRDKIMSYVFDCVDINVHQSPTAPFTCMQIMWYLVFPSCLWYYNLSLPSICLSAFHALIRMAGWWRLPDQRECSLLLMCHIATKGRQIAKMFLASSEFELYLFYLWLSSTASSPSHGKLLPPPPS